MDHLRHSMIYNHNNLKPVTLIGAGGIGALTAIVLAKMGVPMITIFDDDTVDNVNLATQFHRTFDVGRNKAQALADSILGYADETDVVACGYRVSQLMSDPGEVRSPIIISAVDSIKARQEIWKVIRRLPWKWYFDARMGAEVFHLHCVSRENSDWYDQKIRAEDESKVEELPCTARATIFTACFSAGHIAAALRKIATGQALPKVLVHNIIENVLFTL